MGLHRRGILGTRKDSKQMALRDRVFSASPNLGNHANLKQIFVLRKSIFEIRQAHQQSHSTTSSIQASTRQPKNSAFARRFFLVLSGSIRVYPCPEQYVTSFMKSHTEAVGLYHPKVVERSPTRRPRWRDHLRQCECRPFGIGGASAGIAIPFPLRL